MMIERDKYPCSNQAAWHNDYIYEKWSMLDGSVYLDKF